jgi:hypothetical protein
MGFTPYHLGEPVDGAIVQTNHDEYRTTGPDALPGIRALVDGRNVTSPQLWTGVPRRVIGA